MKDFVPADFFAFRTPLLSFDELQSWSAGLQASSALNDFNSLEKALAEDRERLRIRLEEILSRPAVREALFIASPDLDEAFNVWVWLREPKTKRVQGLEHALVRYFIRMAGRSTPFGLFAGCSIGSFGDKTDLVLEDCSKYQRHTRLGMDYLSTLTQELGRDRALRNILVYRPNSSLHRVAGRVRYVASQMKDKERSFHLVTAEDTDYLIATITRAENGATFETLASALVDGEVSLDEAEEYIQELIESQIIVADIALPLTGREPVYPLIEQLSGHPQTNQIAEKLTEAHAALAAMDVDGLGVSSTRYRSLAQSLNDLPAAIDLPRLFQVDMIKPAPKATLGTAVVTELLRGVELLHRLSRPIDHEQLKKFRDAFFNRYEMREIPLLEALDEEIGIGFGTGRETTPLLDGLHFPQQQDESAKWGAREKFLLRKLNETLQSGAHEMVLQREDIENLEFPNRRPLPDAFTAMAGISSQSKAAPTQEAFRVFLDFVTGPPADMLARFCYADPELRQHLEKHILAEERLQSDAVFAEIVHLPEGHFGNFICRPVLRGYEIPYLGCSGVASSQQIAAADLTVSVRRDRIILRSQRLGREVIPRMSNAHNFGLSGLSVYRFLCSLQFQGVAQNLRWDWGALNDAPFLPRVVTGRLVLARTQWRVGIQELKRLGDKQGATLFQEVQAWRAERRLPRWIALADGDNILPIDLDNVLSIEVFVHLVRSRDEATLIEIYPAPDELCAHGPEGRFVHELIVPFIRISKPQRPSERHRSINAFPLSSAVRTFPPGSDWLFAKLYTGAGDADRILSEVAAPLVQKLMDSGAIDRWFFIRYGDPDWHLRVRFHGAPEKLYAEVLPAFQAAVSPLLDNGELWRIQLDTYEREVERYGGTEGIEFAERLFQVDSEAVLQLISMLEPGDQGLDQRWRLTMRGIDVLLTDFGFDLHSKCQLLRKVSKHSGEQGPAEKNLRNELSEKFRKERKGLEELLDSNCDTGSPLLLSFDVLRKRSKQIAPIVAELKACEHAGWLMVSIQDFALSCAHMYANRLLRSAHSEQESVIHDFLLRLYESKAARSRAMHSE